jgi:hypothetical protein
MDKKVYFAGSIRGSRRDQKIYSDFIGFIENQGVQVLCEHVGYADVIDQGQNLNPTEIHNRDLAWIDESNAVIAEVTNPSLGVGYKIHRALSIGKPVLTLFARMVDGPRLSAMIVGAGEQFPNLTNIEYHRGPNGFRVARVAITDFLNSLG